MLLIIISLLLGAFFYAVRNGESVFYQLLIKKNLFNQLNKMCYLGGGSTHDKLIFLLKEEYAKIENVFHLWFLKELSTNFIFMKKIIINVTVIHLVQKIRTKLMFLKKTKRFNCCK